MGQEEPVRETEASGAIRQEAKNLKEKECGPCPQRLQWNQDTSEKVNEKAGEYQGFCWVAANRGEVKNTKAPVSTMLFSPRPPNTRIGSSMVPSFQQGFSVSSKETMNCQECGSRGDNMSWILSIVLPQIMFLPFNFVFQRDGSKTYHHFYANFISKRWPLFSERWACYKDSPFRSWEDPEAWGVHLPLWEHASSAGHLESSPQPHHPQELASIWFHCVLICSICLTEIWMRICILHHDGERLVSFSVVMEDRMTTRLGS